MNAATPPSACACAMACSVSVVLPDDSLPKISTTRPRGQPPQPNARSSPTEPEGMTAIFCSSSDWPSCMIAPLPNCFSIDCTAAITAFNFSEILLIVRSRSAQEEFPRGDGQTEQATDRAQAAARRDPGFSSSAKSGTGVDAP